MHLCNALQDCTFFCFLFLGSRNGALPKTSQGLTESSALKTVELKQVYTPIYRPSIFSTPGTYSTELAPSPRDPKPSSPRSTIPVCNGGPSSHVSQSHRKISSTKPYIPHRQLGVLEHLVSS
ncbi:hypothetical protein K491DRAFT_699656 [Lophiostoma macrostomum CBS 122681]|uniref:Uncharacterized protein n=1 Tax=Lophiostoma macrostomum CBS 122681 TaxID=1314788 RepID=A0A6A6SI04_9PLEO|nr:hypothetical protein K491DRAFT_699656 [Lophiostoma macrostomum CBS 122681]